MNDHISQSKKATHTIVIYPHTPDQSMKGVDSSARLEEAQALAQAIHLKVVHAEVINLKQIRPNTLIGQGNVDNLKGIIAATETTLVVMDTNLSPIQQRNLEKAWKVKVIDRTGLILEIFGERAQTKEGSLQVELAALNYQKSRLVRSWTHLERQRGGLGFIGGPGETQLEMDRRIISDRILRIEKDLKKVKERRGLQRRARKRVPYPVVALVGYTNAGKSTLFNHLTKADVFAENLLFATLDPTMRLLRLPSGQHIILSDTVGFISDLPTLLVAAFRATLEEVQEADLILHIRDCANPNHDVQAKDVYGVLKDLGVAPTLDGVVDVFNKVDALSNDQRADLPPKALKISALTGEGMGDLLNAIDQTLQMGSKIYHLKLRLDQGKELAWLHAHGEVLQQRPQHEHLSIRVKMKPQNWDRFQSLFVNERSGE